MFTGIVQAVGTIAALDRRGHGARLRVSGAAGLLHRLKRGDSIAVNGCCLTILAKRAGAFDADLTRETLERTSFGPGDRALGPGARVNLEPPLRMGDALSGHIVQGHIEATGQLIRFEPAGHGPAAGWNLQVKLPPALLKHVASKGSLAVDGISLTVASMARATATFAIIPFTWRHTNLRFLTRGALLNLETDMMARGKR